MTGEDGSGLGGENRKFGDKLQITFRVWAKTKGVRRGEDSGAAESSLCPHGSHWLVLAYSLGWRTPALLLLLLSTTNPGMN